MNTIEIANEKYPAASTWNEFAEHVIYFCALLAKKYSARQIKRRIAARFTGIPLRTYMLRINNIQRMQIEDTYDFLFSKSTLTKNPLPAIRIGFRKYYGPADELRNITVAEFATADRHYNEYIKTQDKKHLHLMIAALWRPTNIFIRIKKYFTGRDIRAKFNDKVLDKRAHTISRLGEKYIQAAALFYAGTRDLFPQKFPLVFSTEKTNNASFGWAGIIVDMAGDKYGTPDDVEQMMYWNLLFVINKNEVQRMEAERRSSKN